MSLNAPAEPRTLVSSCTREERRNNMYTYIWIYMHIFTYTHTRLYMYTYTHTYRYIYTCICPETPRRSLEHWPAPVHVKKGVIICVHIYEYICIYLHLHTRAYIYLHIRTHIDIYIHVYVLKRPGGASSTGQLLYTWRKA